jgi:hypothetical protein
MNDYLRGTRYPLALVQTDISVTQTPRAIASKSKLN